MNDASHVQGAADAVTDAHFVRTTGAIILQFSRRWTTLLASIIQNARFLIPISNASTLAVIYIDMARIV